MRSSLRVVSALFTLALPILLGSPRIAIAQQTSWIKADYHRGDFKLVYGGRAAQILVSPDDSRVVHIAAGDLAADVERVTGKRAVVRREASGLSEQVVLVGTLGKSQFIDWIVSAGKLELNSIQGK